MKIIEVEISWSGKNYCCGFGLEGVGAILCTNKDIEKLKIEFADSLQFHTETMTEEGEKVPQWLRSGEYVIEYGFSISSILHLAELYTTIATISRVTGISRRLLNAYACSSIKPRLAQRNKIVNGLHKIGRNLIAIG